MSKLSAFGGRLGYAALTAFITLAAAFGIQAYGNTDEVVQRVDENSQAAVRVALETRYINMCALFTPPYPERKVEEAQLCEDEALAMPEGIRPSDWLAINLETRSSNESS